MDNNKLGLEPAFPMDDYDFSNDEITPTLVNQYKGMSKRFYSASIYADIAYKYADTLSIKESQKVLNIKDTMIWDNLTHFPMLVAKLQYMFADEFLKQENL